MADKLEESFSDLAFFLINQAQADRARLGLPSGLFLLPPVLDLVVLLFWLTLLLDADFEVERLRPLADFLLVERLVFFLDPLLPVRYRVTDNVS